ncbi:MAG: hypothetical protein ACI4C1_08490 [Lachnospiraceae bacterium]
MSQKIVIHIMEETFQKWNMGELSQEQEMELLEHISTCNLCADRWAQHMTGQLIEPPAYLEEEILERVQLPDVQVEGITRHISKQAQLFLYSLKVSLAVAAAILMLIGSPDIDFLENPVEEHWVYKEPDTPILDQLGAGSDFLLDKMKQVTEQISQWQINIKDSEERENDVPH